MNTEATLAIDIDVPDFMFIQMEQRPQLFYELLSANQQEELKSFLFDLLQDKDGAPEFDDFQVHLYKFNALTKEGSLRLKFTINRRFCCADTTACQMDYVDFDFSYVKERIGARARYFNWNLDN